MSHSPHRRGALRCAALFVVAAPTVALGAGNTDPTGANTPFSIRQPTLDLSFVVQDSGSVGEIRIFPYATLPSMWIPASGQQFPVAQNTELAGELGSTFGGDGVNTFALPNLNGRLAVGTGAAAGFGLMPRAKGELFGNNTVALTESQLPAHTHGLPGGEISSSVGNNQPFALHQPSLGLRFGISTEGVFPIRSRGFVAGTPTSPFLGQIRLLSGASTPDAVMEADGQQLLIAPNTGLFSLLGTQFGGNGQTHFALPDLRARTPIGQGQGLGFNDRFVGETDGADQKSLFTFELPAHQHTIPDPKGGGITDPTGGGQPFEIMQPSLTMNFLIRVDGTYPDFGAALDADTGYLGEIILVGSNFAPGGGWATCEGQILSIQQNPALFNLLGTNFGGDGVTTFALPDLRGRAIEGFDGALRAAGDQDGAEITTLTVDNLPAHTHIVPSPAGAALLLLASAGALTRRRR